MSDGNSWNSKPDRRDQVWLIYFARSHVVWRAPAVSALLQLVCESPATSGPTLVCLYSQPVQIRGDGTSRKGQGFSRAKLWRYFRRISVRWDSSAKHSAPALPCRDGVIVHKPAGPLKCWRLFNFKEFARNDARVKMYFCLLLGQNS